MKRVPVRNYEGRYEIDTNGVVWSVKTGAPLAPSRRPDGYLHVNLKAHKRQRSFLVHRLVLETFVGKAPSEDHVACHNDGVRTNNRLENLRWDTHAGNLADMVAHGTKQIGEKSATARLTEAQVHEIRRRRGEPQKDLAAEFGCTFSNISAIQRKVSWRHV